MSTKAVVLCLQVALNATPEEISLAHDVLDRAFGVVNGEGDGPTNPADIAAANSGEVDKSGIRWDERIHSSTKAKNADGSWKKRRGVDDATVARVTAELKSSPNVAATTVAVATPAPAAPGLAVPGANVAPTLAPAPPNDFGYGALVARVTRNIAPAGPIPDAAWINTVVAYVVPGKNTLPEIAGDANAIAGVVGYLDQQGVPA